MKAAAYCTGIIEVLNCFEVGKGVGSTIGSFFEQVIEVAEVGVDGGGLGLEDGGAAAA
ncbi:hypothetical protein Hanom_Chr07g00624451 [Helianthus anomalus]